MEFYTVVLRQSAGYWVSLCLENGLVGQGSNPEDSISKLKEAIESFQDVYEMETKVFKAPISIEELHEFLTVEGEDISSDIYELRKVYDNC
ncbi:type II toxin-antitoxin system HicB family antitoxin [Planktothrix sp. FACHB-1355]|uniref:Type II toxin-antitoxin system HicB family antitoxin n=1 Tax=Aerosakkonema funiforme FACHB-1375 TaxID=2949571 RepID=A0A926VDB3_9CYAN|nr:MULTISPECIES: type II toxin-antitoxin system HicB family antitoxin [Oscillatoriales]MBD2181727.1 type II toxin-antitoxin system HicB family antitoxin [Aerosakkonema funiforme FACHB-1375]MBD3560985.1 type II toxin-antitoxin system HicB family antitoxin [Planktothrix sp. FACHB-1355]